MTVHGSLQYLLEEGERITVYCPKGHGAEVDLARAIDVFGPEFKIVGNRPRFLHAFVCKQCGARASNLIMHPPAVPFSPLAPHKGGPPHK